MRKDGTDYAELVYIRTKIKKITSVEMADLLGISAATYLRSERGERDFTLVEAVIIARKFKMPIDKVFPKIFSSDVA